jgi:rubrerythrin
MPFLRNALLKAEPAGVVNSLEELFGLASAMEQEAATRYAELAEDMQRQGRSDLAAVFGDLAAAEREHVDSVTRWSQSRCGKVPDVSLIRWQAPETFDREAAAEARTSKLMTPYRAIAMAVRNEERAFAFWSYLAAFVGDPEVKKAAEAMADEELGHVATLRKARRQAYRKDLAASASNKTGELIDAGVMERKLADRLDQFGSTMDPAQAARIRELADEARLMSSEAQGFGQFPQGAEQGDAEILAETLADAYLDGADTSIDPASLEKLQSLASRSIVRLAWLRSLSG